MDSLPNEDTRRGGISPSHIGFTSNVFPKADSSQNGVSPDSVLIHCPTASSESKSKEAVWFLMRAAYGQEWKAKERLEADSIEVFLPIEQKVYVTNGKRKYKKKSLIPNFLFVHSTEEKMKNYIGKPGLEYFHHYYVHSTDTSGYTANKDGLKPLVIPDQQMRDFRRWHEIDDDNKLFVPEGEFPLKNGEKVEVIGGKFKGLCGYVCRMKRQSRIGIHINGFGTIFTAYIPKAFLTKV